MRAKFVLVDPRFSVTAAKADEWLPVNPGTDAVLALAMAHVIVRDGLYNGKFIQEHCHGFDDWEDEYGRHRGFKDYVLKEWPPQKAAKICGIPTDKIEQVAREFAAKAPHCIAAGARGTSMQSNGVITRFAIHALNGLVGSIDARGGVLTQMKPPFTDWPDCEPDPKDPTKKILKVDEIAKQGLKMPRLDYAGTAKYPLAGKVYQDIPDRILEGKPYPVNALLCYYTNPFFSSPDIDRWPKAIEKIPFVATFSPFMDETTLHADLVLPDHTYLERWHDDVIYPSMGYPVVGIRQPVVKPLFDTRNTMDVLLQVAHKIGGRVRELFPWKDAVEVLRFRYRGLFESGGGTFTAESFDEWWEKFIRLGVWTAPPYPHAGEHPDRWPQVLVHHEKKKAEKEPGKFMFYSLHLRHKLEHLAEDEAKRKGTTVEAELENMLKGLKVAARGDELYLPHYEPVRYVGDPAEFPLILVTYKTIAHAEGRGANSPLAQERFCVQTGERWTACAQMNPQTAARLGLKENDEVWVHSSIGRVRMRLKLLPHHPDVVVVPFELGHLCYGRWARGRGENPNHIIAKENDRLGGLASYFSTRVKVYRA